MNQIRGPGQRQPSQNRTHTFIIVAFAAAAVLGIAGCGGGGGDSSSGSEATTTSSSSGSAGTPTGTKADANKASVDELTAAFTAAGVPNAGKWAREVEEYRPYPTNDSTFAKLRQKLAKYNPAAEDVEKIVGALSL